ncbi:hypothetical protein WL1483_3068 [Aeromonas schubertii]|uniref:Uncharacterized protein n=1 Tax=Aeromonas schubertii TaxID=652 RepID=A0A0S2SL75_9GAMM|nr:hypothetical protein WL1483_3068 [Aeromonas schubertii]
MFKHQHLVFSLQGGAIRIAHHPVGLLIFVDLDLRLFAGLGGLGRDRTLRGDKGHLGRLRAPGQGQGAPKQGKQASKQDDDSFHP